MVLAGPGSGKTFTIVQRVAYLIRECHVKPDQILVMTFTRKAALQMRERIRGTGAGRVRFGTFHSVYYQILLEEGDYTLFAGSSSQDRAVEATVHVPGTKPGFRDSRKHQPADHFDTCDNLAIRFCSSVISLMTDFMDSRKSAVSRSFKHVLITLVAVSDEMSASLSTSAFGFIS